MIIGEGTNEIQQLVIARNLIKNYPSGDFFVRVGLVTGVLAQQKDTICN